jgi:hypothetical protein
LDHLPADRHADGADRRRATEDPAELSLVATLNCAFLAFNITTGAAGTVLSITTDASGAALSFDPKAIELWIMGRTETGSGLGSGTGVLCKGLIGLFDNRGHLFAGGNGYADNAFPSAAAGYMTDSACVALPCGGAGTSVLATAVINSGGFTLTNIGQAFGAVRVMGLVLGGATASYLLTTAVAAGWGNDTVTGLRWQADGVVFLSYLGALAGCVTANSGLDFGVGVSSSHEWGCGSAALDDVGTLVSKGYFRWDECAVAVQSQTAVNLRLQYVGRSATGFTVTKPSVPAGGLTLVWVGLKGVSLAAVRLTQSNVVVNIFSGVALAPTALLAMSHSGTQNTAGMALGNSAFSLGLGMSTSNRLTLMVQHFGGVIGPTFVVMSVRGDCLLHGVGGSSAYTVDSLLDLSAFGSTTCYVMDDPSGSPYDFGYLVVGDWAGTGRNRCYFIG